MDKYFFTKEINDDVVDSYTIQTYDSDITCLCINTKDRWVDFNRLNNNEYDLSNNVFWGGEKTEVNTYKLIIDGDAGEYLENIYKHIVTQMQVKDQICFYFIPFELITSNEKVKNWITKQRLELKNK
jgi:hypothetical protein